MKIVTIVLLSATIIAATKIPLRDGITPQKLGPVDSLQEPVEKQIPWESLKQYLLEYGQKENDFIHADVTDFLLKILTNVRPLIIEKGLDPMTLSDEEQNLFPVGSIKLSNGYIQDLSSISVSGAAVAKYTYGSKILELVVPLSFDSILINYDYVTHITLIKVSGAVKAKVSDVRINMRIYFDFTNFHAFIDELDVSNSGKIKVDFTGLGLLDWIIDAMANVVTVVFHKIILLVLDILLYNPVRSQFDQINSLVDKILNPSVSS